MERWLPWLKYFKEELSGGRFVPVQGNILIVGEAAGLQLPVSGEGIGLALESGLIAAHSIAEAMASKRGVAEIYLPQFESLQNMLKELSPWNKKIEEESTRGPSALLTAFADGLRATLRVT